MAHYLNRDEALSRLSDTANAAVRPHAPERIPASSTGDPGPSDGHVQPEQRGGRTPGAQNLSTEMKARIAMAAKKTSNKEVAEKLGIHRDRVSDYKNGITSHNSRAKNVELAELIEQKSEVVRSDAFDKALDALGLLTKDKMLDLNAMQLSQIARDLASTGAKMNAGQSVVGNGLNVVIFAPKIRGEEDFHSIEIEARQIS